MKISQILFASSAAGAMALVSACTAVDVPPPNDPQVQEWSIRIKDSYPDWQPPESVPAGNPDYKPGQLIANPVPDHEIGKEPAEVSALAPAPAAETKAPVNTPEPKSEVKPAAPAAESKSDVKPSVSAAPAAVEKEDTPSATSADAKPVKILTTHKVVKDETFSILAKKYYGDGLKWWKIYQANKDKVSNPNYLPAGLELVIPALENAPVK